MYHQAFKKWQDFALSKFKNSFFPANPVHVAVYLQHAVYLQFSLFTVYLQFIYSCLFTVYLQNPLGLVVQLILLFMPSSGPTR